LIATKDQQSIYDRYKWINSKSVIAQMSCNQYMIAMIGSAANRSLQMDQQQMDRCKWISSQSIISTDKSAVNL
jgi:hypothetical protein